jgi:hypothetical protein
MLNKFRFAVLFFLGSIPMSLYFRYFGALIPLILSIPIVFVLVLAEVVCLFAEYWLGVIGADEEFGFFTYEWKSLLFVCVVVICVFESSPNFNFIIVFFFFSNVLVKGGCMGYLLEAISYCL